MRAELSGRCREAWGQAMTTNDIARAAAGDRKNDLAATRTNGTSTATAPGPNLLFQPKKPWKADAAASSMISDQIANDMTVSIPFFLPIDNPDEIIGKTDQANL